MFFFIDYSDPTTLSLEATDDDNYIQMWLCIQEILFRKGECDFNAELGVDYDSIFLKSSFISTQIDEIIDKYKKYFRAIEYNISQEKHKVAVTIDFSFNFENSPSLGNNPSKASAKILLGQGEVDVYS